MIFPFTATSNPAKQTRFSQVREDMLFSAGLEMTSRPSIRIKITAGRGVQPQEYCLSFCGVEFPLLAALKGAKRLQAKHPMFGIQEPEARIQ